MIDVPFYQGFLNQALCFTKMGHLSLYRTNGPIIHCFLPSITKARYNNWLGRILKEKFKQKATWKLAEDHAYHEIIYVCLSPNTHRIHPIAFPSQIYILLHK